MQYVAGFIAYILAPYMLALYAIFAAEMELPGIPMSNLAESLLMLLAFVLWPAFVNTMAAGIIGRIFNQRSRLVWVWIAASVVPVLASLTFAYFAASETALRADEGLAIMFLIQSLSAPLIAAVVYQIFAVQRDMTPKATQRKLHMQFLKRMAER